MSLAKRLEVVRRRIADAALASGRLPDEVGLIAVTKTLPAETIIEAISLGVTDVGENKVQELTEKLEQVNAPVSWHMIGHLQSNKVKYILDKVALIHSLDRLSLAKEVEKRAAQIQRQVPVLIQVNVAEEEQKFGLPPEEVVPFLQKVSQFKHIEIQGLMTMAPYVSDPEEVRWVFRSLRQLRDRIAAMNMKHVAMGTLSMGMSNDFQVAIEEGATMVRVGSLIFGERR